MKILIVTEFFPFSDQCDVKGGVEARAFHIARHLAKRHKVTVITSRETGTKEKDSFAGIEVIRVGNERDYSQGGKLSARLSFVREAMKAGKKLSPDVVDGYNFVSYPAAYKIARLHKVPAVATYHDVWIGGEWVKNMGPSGMLGEIVERRILSMKWSHFIAVSNYTKGKLETKGKVEPSRITVVYNGIDKEKYSLGEVKKQPESICFVGRLVKYKRVDLLLKAAKIMLPEFPSLLIKIIGVGPERESLEKMANELGLKEHVKFFGFVEKHEDVVKEIATSKLFCLPSDVEGFGIVTVEALAAGTPFINSAIPPTIEVTDTGKGGQLFEPGNELDLADKASELLKDQSFYDKCLSEAPLVLEKYDWEKLAFQVEHVYENAGK
jgi:glycosyltransferase involved in cell wall biosynthesis